MEKHRNGNKIEIKINSNELKYDKKTAKSIIRRLARIRKNADFMDRNIVIDTGDMLIENTHKYQNEYEFFIKTAILAVQMQNKKERYEFLYNEICFYLDDVCRSNNLCEFCDDKCFVKKDTDVTMGCCHHFPNKYFGMFYQKEMVPCEYLGEHGCTTQTIGCKLFMCDDINKKGYKFTVFNVLLIRYFYNFIQKIIIKCGIFTTKEKVMKYLEWFEF